MLHLSLTGQATRHRRAQIVGRFIEKLATQLLKLIVVARVRVDSQVAPIAVATATAGWAEVHPGEVAIEGEDGV